MKIVYLGFGSNVGDRETALREAVRKLESRQLRLLNLSSVYETEPVGYNTQGWFLNLCAEFETELFPHQLLLRTQKVEHEMGRRRTLRNGPRIIDIDILLYGRASIKTKDLTIPHPRYHERRFVLAPLAELGPHLRDPASGRTTQELLGEVAGQTVRLVGPLR